MLQEALRKLQLEVSDGKKGSYVAPVGSMLMDHVRKHPEHAPAICTEGKTIAGGIKAMEDVARKRQSGGSSAYISDEEGLRIVLRYFGIDAPEPPPPVQFGAAPSLGLSVDDLL
jgi:hypothetical protein